MAYGLTSRLDVLQKKRHVFNQREKFLNLAAFPLALWDVEELQGALKNAQGKLMNGLRMDRAEMLPQDPSLFCEHDPYHAFFLLISLYVF